jgi:glutamate/tyrosine decarboxylase-like PLP-dependent enzyme
MHATPLALDASPLALDAETMRRLGYAVVDMLVERAHDGDAPAIVRASRAEMELRLREQAPAQGRPFEELLEQLVEDVLPFAIRFDHPRNFSYIPSSGTWPGALGDFIAAACNFNAMFWMTAPGPSEVEVIVLDWFKEWLGYPPDAAGVLVSGGSAANLTALACARETRLGAMSDRVVAYVSDQAHSSFARAARLLGFQPDQVRVLPVDEQFRLRPDALEQAMLADEQAGREPLFVAATVGTTNTGAVDSLVDLEKIAHDHGAWFHVDGAYGGFAVLTERGRKAFAGIELADSVTMDPHKWLYQPYECGCVLVREGANLRSAFHISPDYLKDAAGELVEVNFADQGLQLARTTHALKLWLSLKFFGVDAFRTAIDRALDIAREAEDRIQSSPVLELLAPVALGIVCFRRRFDGASDEELDQLNRQLTADLVGSGDAVISSTSLRGRYAVRMCVLNHTTTRGDVMRVLDWFEQASQPDVTHEEESEWDERGRIAPTRGWLAPPDELEEALGQVPLLRSLNGDQLTRVLAAGATHVAAPGDTIVAQWESSRDLYLILGGRVEVQAEGKHVRDLGRGEFFGEFAAMDWGASFGYPRLGSVIAQTHTRLFSVPPETLGELMHEVPTLDRELRRVVRSRMYTPVEST